MALTIYNTLKRKKEEFKPIDPPNVGMYVCGVTVYDLSHIGHARSAIAFDIIYRYLKHSGYKVNFVRNFTDIDDKIINRANELDISTGELTAKFIKAFSEDMKSLGLLEPNLEPHCTDYIEKMVTYIERLIEKDMAYVSESGDVYYRVKKFEGYGKLSGKNIDDLLAGARVEISDQKESPLDFALWKSSKPGEPKWPSPFSEGRPGWHIECSAMSQATIGETLDIHGGGKDLIFPHHENEIAQSEAYSGKAFANLWIHNGFVNVPSSDDPDGTKMSKSLGNFFTIRDVLQAFHPQAIKFFMLSTHYRNDILFTEEGLNSAQNRLVYCYATLKQADKLIAENRENNAGTVLESHNADNLMAEFESAMDDDFNTQKAFGQLSATFKQMNDLINNQQIATEDKNKIATLTHIRAELSKIANVLGVFDLEPTQFESDLKTLRSSQLDIDPAYIEQMIEDRKQARIDKNWGRADEIRDELMEKGIIIKDSKDGTSWSVKS